MLWYSGDLSDYTSNKAIHDVIRPIVYGCLKGNFESYGQVLDSLVLMWTHAASHTYRINQPRHISSTRMLHCNVTVGLLRSVWDTSCVRHLPNYPGL